MTELSHEKRTNFAPDQVTGYGFNMWTRDCGCQWHIADIPKPSGLGIWLSKKD